LILSNAGAWNGSALAVMNGLVEASAGWPAVGVSVVTGAVDSLPEQAASARLMAAARMTVRDM